MKYIYIIVSIFIVLSCSSKKDKSTELSKSIKPQFTEFPIDCSIRAIEVLDENTMWFAGNKGMIGNTKDGGANWFIDSISMDGKLGLWSLEQLQLPLKRFFF